ncbi:MAG: DegT/DnrJ/EryC1/StrS family aminotransferase [Pelagibacteraceae bacterium TMED233]|nr:aminotransferase DegT [Candidatus Pelagibacter sp.]RPG06294.1 MAG: DegT/DnrJ/EryC1/StrS family aminotransferase [Pelagibacteraceae bacterium TMED233]
MKKKLKSKKYEFIPVNKPLIEKKDITEILRSLKRGWISSDGPEVKSFEENFSKLINRKYSTAVSNGTAALEIAIKALDIKKGDEVIIPNFTIISNALAVIRQNAKPVLIDCEKENWNMKIDDIEKKITKKTRAIIATHIYNFPVDIDKIIKICKKYKIFLIEDAAEVIGQKYKNKMCGSFGDISTFSFYANKQITTGEGGMISTNNPKIYQKCKSLRNLCFGVKDRFNHDDLGWNYRISNIQAALGLSQLKRIKKIVKRREYIGKQYYKKLYINKNIQILKPVCSFAKNIYWVVGLVIKNNISAKTLAKRLNKYGIQTRPFFWPMHKQTILRKMGLFKGEKYPNSEYLSKYGLYLPSSLSLKSKQISFISKKVNEIIK